MAVARLRDLSIAPRKMRIIANMVRGQSVTGAINSLRFLHKAGSREVFKLLVSAVANAEDQDSGDIDDLIVSKIWVDAGSVSRRWRPRAMGRGNRVEKKTSHVYVELGAAEGQAAQ